MHTVRVELCSICSEPHDILVDLPKKKAEKLTALRYSCPSLDRRYRLNGFYLNTQRNLFHESHEVVKPYANETKEYLKHEVGEKDFEAKFKRWFAIDYPAIRMIEDDYSNKVEDIVQAYVQGSSYSASTAAGALAERILNTLVITLRHYYKSHPHYEIVKGKKSFSNWNTMIEALEEWGVLSVEASKAFKVLKRYRNKSVHYNKGYDFATHAPLIIDNLMLVIKEVFGVQNRTDIFLVFDIPGEVWVRSEAAQLPFVREFILPNCYYAHAVHEIDFETGTVTERLGKLGKLTDEEFVELRKNSK